MKTIKGYKAYKKGLICNGFQYEVGKEHTHTGELKICSSGFHFCENPLDVLNYYDLFDCEFTEVEAIGKIEKDKSGDDTKLVTDKIKIGVKLDLPAFVKASFDFLWEKCFKEKKDDDVQAASGNSSKLAASGYSSQLAASGDSSQLAASGNSSKLAASGYSSQLAASGNSSQLAASGNSSQLAASGYSSKLAASGDSSQLAASGNSSQLAASGNSSKLAASGYSSQLELNGNDSVGANIGIEGIIKGKNGCWITLAEYDSNYKIKCVKSVKIDGKKIKEDTWYKLENGKFTIVK